MACEMRGLKTKDIYKMSRILKKMNLKPELNETMTEMQMGFKLIQTALENLHLAEDEVNEFLGDFVGLTQGEFSELEIEETMKVIEDFKSLKGLKSFFKLASTLMK